MATEDCDSPGPLARCHIPPEGVSDCAACRQRILAAIHRIGKKLTAQKMFDRQTFADYQIVCEAIEAAVCECFS